MKFCSVVFMCVDMVTLIFQFPVLAWLIRESIFWQLLKYPCGDTVLQGPGLGAAV